MSIIDPTTDPGAALLSGIEAGTAELVSARGSVRVMTAIAVPITDDEFDGAYFAALAEGLEPTALERYRKIAAGLARYFGLDGKPAEAPGDDVPFTG